ncbi:Hypothetical predicted protein [Lecanosticta acicola]|uniref:Uncharacterized protein n=1 Tax=Lecanosticta acicola TaxID=111012 RepID=A0AAI8YTQ8_9PEZI|nr:Hypothetical predicted protein [Lecanosticta acicola]
MAFHTDQVLKRPAPDTQDGKSEQPRKRGNISETTEHKMEVLMQSSILVEDSSDDEIHPQSDPGAKKQGMTAREARDHFADISGYVEELEKQVRDKGEEVSRLQVEMQTLRDKANRLIMKKNGRIRELVRERDASNDLVDSWRLRALNSDREIEDMRAQALAEKEKWFEAKHVASMERARCADVVKAAKDVVDCHTADFSGKMQKLDEAAKALGPTRKP